MTSPTTSPMTSPTTSTTTSTVPAGTAYYGRVIGSSIGDLMVVANDAGAVVAIDFLEDGSPAVVAFPGMTRWVEETGLAGEKTIQAVEQLQAYFDGTLQHFSLTLAPHGTPFQQEVWKMLLEVPFGQTWTYQALANRLGKPKAVRAVGGANGRNPIPIVIPCHRVIGANGTLTGYGGGLPIKEKLLALEGIFVPAGTTSGENLVHKQDVNAAAAGMSGQLGLW